MVKNAYKVLFQVQSTRFTNEGHGAEGSEILGLAFTENWWWSWNPISSLLIQSWSLFPRGFPGFHIFLGHLPSIPFFCLPLLVAESSRTSLERRLWPTQTSWPVWQCRHKSKMAHQQLTSKGMLLNVAFPSQTDRIKIPCIVDLSEAPSPSWTRVAEWHQWKRKQKGVVNSSWHLVKTASPGRSKSWSAPGFFRHGSQYFFSMK